MANSEIHPWGRVDETGTVFVRDGDREIVVGQYPDATPEEAFEYFERKYTDLTGQLALLEQRAKRSAPALDIARAARTLRDLVSAPTAVGDYETLRRRLDALDKILETLVEKQDAENRAVLDAAIEKRTEIVVRVEELADQDPAKVQWKQTSVALDSLFERWQDHQKNAPRVPKAQANELWQRFRTARTKIEHNRRLFFAELEAAHRDSRNKKHELIERAEALRSQGAAGIPSYRALLDEWKTVKRAGKKHDDALWVRFKAVGDDLYGQKAEIDAKEKEEQTANAELKRILLAEAEPLLAATDRIAARTVLQSIQKRWDMIGRVPRAEIAGLEGRLKAIESAVRALDDDHWKEQTTSAAQARSDDLASQLRSAIEKLEAELVIAEGAGDKKGVCKAQEALDARKAWLKALGE